MKLGGVCVAIRGGTRGWERGRDGKRRRGGGRVSQR